MKAKTFVILGGSGFLGINVARELLYRNYKVKILDNLEPIIKSKICHFQKLIF